MIFAAKKTASTAHAVAIRADRREDETNCRVDVEPSPCMTLPAVDLLALLRARASTPKTILDYLT